MEEVAIPILFFAKARELVGTGSSNISFVKFKKVTGKQLLSVVLKTFPALKDISENIILAVNQQYIDPEQLIEVEHTLEVAVIPPLSGG